MEPEVEVPNLEYEDDNKPSNLYEDDNKPSNLDNMRMIIHMII